MEDETQTQEHVADEELRLLEAMAAVSKGMQQVRGRAHTLLTTRNARLTTHPPRQMNQVLSTLNRQSVELSQELATAERQMVRACTHVLCVEREAAY